MKYICLFENFEEGHKFDIFDLFTITPKEVEELFFKELERNPPDLENIQVFLDSGFININSLFRSNTNLKQTILHIAVINSNLELVKFLVEYGIDVNVKDSYGNIPLHFSKSLSVANFLIESGSEINARNKGGATPLICMSEPEDNKLGEIESLKIINFLIKSGADINARTNRGETALTVALENGSSKIADFLETNGGVE